MIKSEQGLEDQSQSPPGKGEAETRHEAWLYEAFEDGKVRCHLCAHHCMISDGKLGVCQVRKNVGGSLFTLSYGQVISEHVDPIEKKPLYHFYPGTTAYSIATPGCNFRCKWCQNWHISQFDHGRHILDDREVTPEQVVAAARYAGSSCIAYTYTEPTIFFEFTYDTARLAHQAGVANVYVTNGYMTEDMLSVFGKYLDGANVDLKAFQDITYKRQIGAKLQPVLDSLRKMKEMGVWIEVTTLVVPEVNDDPGELREIGSFISQELGPETPWHISRFFPHYQWKDHPPTPMRTLRRAREIGLKEGLHYVYVGNVLEGSDTNCTHCGRVLIRRLGYSVYVHGLQEGRCMGCGAHVAGVGMNGG